MILCFYQRNVNTCFNTGSGMRFLTRFHRRGCSCRSILFLRKRKQLNQLFSKGLPSQDVEDEVTADICVVYL